MKEWTANEKKRRMAIAVASLKTVYPEALCALSYGGDAWKLLVMGSLSAQCTDRRVNLACQDLFAHFPTAAALAAARREDVEKDICQCGLYHTKAKNIIAASRMLVEEYNGTLPDRMEDLLRFPGVGRKVANLLLGDIYRQGSVVTDTHCIRICGRLGMYPESEKRPPKIERILDGIIEKEEQTDFCHRIVQFGRDTCQARAPKCDACPLGQICRHKEEALGKTEN